MESTTSCVVRPAFTRTFIATSTSPGPCCTVIKRSTASMFGCSGTVAFTASPMCSSAASPMSSDLTSLARKIATQISTTPINIEPTESKAPLPVIHAATRAAMAMVRPSTAAEFSPKRMIRSESLVRLRYSMSESWPRRLFISFTLPQVAQPSMAMEKRRMPSAMGTCSTGSGWTSLCTPS